MTPKSELLSRFRIGSAKRPDSAADLAVGRLASWGLTLCSSPAYAHHRERRVQRFFITPCTSSITTTKQ